MWQYGASAGVSSVGRSARSLVIKLVRRHIGARSYRVHRRIGMRLVRSQGILVTIVIRLVAAADTGRFERVKDRKCISIIGACRRYKRMLAL